MVNGLSGAHNTCQVLPTENLVDIRAVFLAQLVQHIYTHEHHPKTHTYDTRIVNTARYVMFYLFSFFLFNLVLCFLVVSFFHISLFHGMSMSCLSCPVYTRVW